MLKQYRATNINNGEIIEGSAQFIADRLGVSVAAIYTANREKFNIKKQWTIDAYDVDGKILTIMRSGFIDEWNKTTKEVRELLKKYPRKVVPAKRKSDFRKPF